MKAIRSCAYPNVSRSGCTVERGCRVHRLIARRACRLGSRQASHLIDLERKRSCTGSVHSSGSSLHETRESGSSHAAELVSCWRAWPDASGTSPRDAPREPLRRDLSARPPRRERVGERKMWGRGERRPFAGKTEWNSVVHTPPYPVQTANPNASPSLLLGVNTHSFSCPFFSALSARRLSSRQRLRQGLTFLDNPCSHRPRLCFCRGASVGATGQQCEHLPTASRRHIAGRATPECVATDARVKDLKAANVRGP